MNTVLKTQVKKFLKQTFFIGALFSASAFAFIRLMIYPLPIELGEDGMIFLKTILTGWLIVMIGKGAFEGLVYMGESAQRFIQNYIQSAVDRTSIYKSTNFVQEYLFKAEEKRRIGQVRFFNKIVKTTETKALVQE
ncbi:hypothetical protein [Ferruginibacter sp. SUN106]|uniref:hypothetical protein n=1 Tax=Ferruginibacter sp. SUN106 TaxID=2978348 RepID=UPI003D35A67B